MFRLKHYSYVYILAVLACVIASPVALSGDTFCAEASFAELNSTVRAHGEIGADQTCFESYLPAPGIWMLEVGVSSSAEVEPRLEIPEQQCAGNTRFFRYRERHANRLMLEIHGEGTYQFCVSAQDPNEVLGNYKLMNTFVPSLKTDDPDESEPEPDPLVDSSDGVRIVLKTDDPDESEPEPDPLVDSTDGLRIVLKADDPDESEPEPDPLVDSSDGVRIVLKTDDPDESEPEPDPLVLPPSVWVKESCRTSLDDDHSDLFACATPIARGDEIHAEIYNGWGDDADVFTFTVNELTSLKLATLGHSDVIGGLYDHNGYRLATDDDSGDGANFRIVKTLSRGHYYVRVEGAVGAEGAYRLLVQDLTSLDR